MPSPAAILQILVTANTAQATAALAKTQAQLRKTADPPPPKLAVDSSPNDR